jgi:RNA polymerase sigma factor (TIGR02999 family)
MDTPSVSQQRVTDLLMRWSDGDDAALAELTPLVYEELRRLAHRQMGAERTEHTLQTTALVNEAYLRLADQTNLRWQNRAHFFAVAARAMRRIWLATPGVSDPKSAAAARSRSNWTKQRWSHQRNQRKLSICTRRWKDWPHSTQEKLKSSS